MLHYMHQLERQNVKNQAKPAEPPGRGKGKDDIKSLLRMHYVSSCRLSTGWFNNTSVRIDKLKFSAEKVTDIAFYAYFKNKNG